MQQSDDVSASSCASKLDEPTNAAARADLAIWSMTTMELQNLRARIDMILVQRICGDPSKGFGFDATTGQWRTF